MKSYDGLNSSDGTHTIKISLQNEEYKGFFTREIGGNCKGMNIMDFDVSCYDEEDIAKWKKTECTIEIDDEILLVMLTNPETGDTCEYELEEDEFMQMVVGIEIIDFQKDE